MTKYVMEKLPNLKGTKKEIHYPRLFIEGIRTTHDFAEKMQLGTSFTEADIMGIMSGLAEFIAHETGKGYAVRLDGIGTFWGKVGLKKEALPETDKGTQRNAQNIEFNGVRMRVSKQLVRRARTLCKLKRHTLPARPPKIHSREARLEAALAEIERIGFIRIADYARLSGLGRTMAGEELRTFKAEGALKTHGRGTQKVYVWK